MSEKELTLSSSQITELFSQVQSGNQNARDLLVQHLYNELRQIASSRRYSFKSNQTLNTTALVNETWLKLNKSDIAYNDKKHFLSVAAIAMRQILLDEAKSKQRLKRHDLGSVTFEASQFSNPLDVEAEWLCQLELILKQLERHSPRLALVFNLKFFCGLTLTEIAEIFEVSDKTAQRDWEKSKLIIGNTFSHMNDED